MSTVEIPKETWPGAVREVTLGAGAADGGTRTSTVTVGGEITLPFLGFEAVNPHRPALAAAWAGVAGDAAAWAARAVEAGADLIALRLRGAHPEFGDRSAGECVATVEAVLGAVGVPLVVYGPGVADKDNEVLVAVAEATKGERLALGLCEDKNYRTIVAGALGNGHVVVAFSPIDVNLAKQLNILIGDMGLPLDRVLMDPNTGALGYGIEYTYSVMERLRLAALMGDAMTQQPMICNLGEESWRQKESRAAEGVPDSWGALEGRGEAWEVTTALTVLEAGADIAVLRHPASLAALRAALDDLTAVPAAKGA
ncbi:MAG TPA: acetyl-CoA decarbonylase/synthase complex subunit delta [Thermoleophilia bacterium]|nr:acetyl-CoA decarbonylase/synthase complex subunit delta [Thermoleophilia bacterium]